MHIIQIHEDNSAQNSFALALKSFWGPKVYKKKRGWGFGGSSCEDGDSEEGDEEDEEGEEEEDDLFEEDEEEQDDYEEDGEEEGKEHVAHVAANWFLVN